MVPVDSTVVTTPGIDIQASSDQKSIRRNRDPTWTLLNATVTSPSFNFNAPNWFEKNYLPLPKLSLMAPDRWVALDGNDSSIIYIGTWFPDFGSKEFVGNYGPPYLHTLHGTSTNGTVSLEFNGVHFTSASFDCCD